MDDRDQQESKLQNQSETQDRHSYENSPWIDVWDFQVTEHVRQDTGDKWWDVKLADGTFIEHNGERLDVSRYHFSTNVEPSLTYGESGQPGAMRGIRFPEQWSLDLRRFENRAPQGADSPAFVETGRIEGVTPKQVADGVRERNQEWKLSHRKARPEQEPGREAAERKQPDMGMTATKPRSTEPAL